MQLASNYRDAFSSLQQFAATPEGLALIQQARQSESFVERMVANAVAVETDSSQDADDKWATVGAGLRAAYRCFAARNRLVRWNYECLGDHEPWQADPVARLGEPERRSRIRELARRSLRGLRFGPMSPDSHADV